VNPKKHTYSACWLLSARHHYTFRPHSVFICCAWISEPTAIISLYRVNWLGFITETEYVYCAVRTALLLFLIKIPFVRRLLNHSLFNIYSILLQDGRVDTLAWSLWSFGPLNPGRKTSEIHWASSLVSPALALMDEARRKCDYRLESIASSSSLVDC